MLDSVNALGRKRGWEGGGSVKLINVLLKHLLGLYFKSFWLGGFLYNIYIAFCTIISPEFLGFNLVKYLE